MLGCCLYSISCRDTRRIHMRLVSSIFAPFPFACVLGLTPFLQVSHVCIPMYTFLALASWVQLPFCNLLCVCIPTYTSVCLFFGSNSLLAGVLSLYTHVCIPLLVLWV